MNEKELIIDSHAHLNFKAFEKDLDKVIRRTLADNVWIVNVGSQYETSCKAVEIAENYKKGIYASVGLHPIHVAKEFNRSEDQVNEIFSYEKYKKLASSGKVVALGETGLDYYYKPKNKLKRAEFKEEQKKVFLNHLELAQELNLPVIIHCRMAHTDLLDILKDNGLNSSQIRGVVHCYTGDWQEAQRYLDMGLYLGFTGIIFKLDMEEVIKKMPLDRILIETDCPYLTPPKALGISERNEPLFVKHIAQEIACIKKVSVDRVIEETTRNALNLFNISL